MSACSLCQAPKAVKTCGECGADVCKNCVRYLPQDQFRFHPAPPAWVAHGVFCADCYESLVEPEIARYEEVRVRSEAVQVVYETYRGFIPCLKKAKSPTRVESADAGKGIALQRLKFLAAWEGYDAVIETKTEGEKLRNHGWETKSWSAEGLFACLDYRRFHPESD